MIRRMHATVVSVVLSLVLATVATGEQNTVTSKSVPLQNVWGVGMPGTRALSVDEDSQQGALVGDVVRALAYDPAKAVLAPEGFVVRGNGEEALRAAHAVLVDGQSRSTSFRSSDELTVVFCSRSFNYYVNVTGVEQRDRTVHVSYRFVPHKTKEVTAHLALVPLPNPGPGDVRVEFEPGPTEGLDVDAWAEKIVCRPFTFTVAN